MIVGFLKKFFRWKDLGWKDHGETFYRFVIFRCKWFSVYLHCLTAPGFLPTSHDHPWHFTTVILKGGYWEQLNCGKVFFRPAPSILYRPAEAIHNVRTNGTCWSLVFSKPKRRGWSFGHCRSGNQGEAVSRDETVAEITG